MTLDELLEQFDEVLDSGIKIPGRKTVVDVEKLRAVVDDIRLNIPAEIKQAKGIVADRADIITNAKREAESIRKNAEDKARAMLEEQEIVRVAKQHSAELVSNAEYKSKELRRVANEYVDEILRRTEETVGSALKSINQSRASFRSLAGSAAPAQPVTQDDDDDTE